MRRITISEAARAWLIALDPSPDHAVRWLTGAGQVLFPLGQAVAAVRTTGHQGLCATTCTRGPAVHHARSGHIYHLVPADTEWTCPTGVLLGAGHWLALPDPAVLAPPGAYWLSAPDGSGTLTDPVALAKALR